MKDKELKEALENTIETLNKTVESLESRIKKIVTFNLNKLGKIEATTNEAINKLAKKITNINKSEKTIKQALLTQLQAFKGVEDTFYTLYHNIKQNQFLFASNPEEGLDNYLDLKKKYIKENKQFIDKWSDVDENYFIARFYKALANKEIKEEQSID